MASALTFTEADAVTDAVRAVVAVAVLRSAVPALMSA
jgi:hypothetical protein